MKRSMVRSSVFVLVVCALLAGSFFAGRLLAGPKAVQASTQPEPVSPSSIDATYSYSTYINGVAVYENRIHVHCASAPTENPGVTYFAYPIGGSSGYTANRLLAIGQTAGMLHKVVWIYYDSDYHSNPPDCNTGDCRLLTGISMVGLP
jgi:hypothetical protein